MSKVRHGKYIGKNVELRAHTALIMEIDGSVFVQFDSTYVTSNGVLMGLKWHRGSYPYGPFSWSDFELDK